MTGAGGDRRLKSAAPIAAAALAVVAAVAGGSLLGEDPQTSISGAPIVISRPAAQDGDAPSTRPRTSVSPAPGPQGALPGVAFNQAPGGAPPVMGMEIVVKFKDDAQVKDIIDAFWRDPSDARARFAAFRRSRPEFAGLRLDRVTYSNELVLVSEDGDAPDRRLAAMREIAKKLASVADISYAEPNMTAHPGGQ